MRAGEDVREINGKFGVLRQKRASLFSTVEYLPVLHFVAI